MEQDKKEIKQLQEDQDNLIIEYNETNNEYSDLIKENYRYQKQKLEMINEIESLKDLIKNNKILRDDIQKVNDGLSLKINDWRLPIHEEMDHVHDKLEYVSNQLGRIFSINLI